MVSANSTSQIAVEIVHTQWYTDTGYAIQYPEQILLGMFVNHHVTTYLQPVEAVVPDFDKAHDLERYYMKNENAKRIVSTVDKESFQQTFMPVDHYTDIISHKETQQSWNG